MARIAKESSHIRLRLEATVLTRLERVAERNGRTMTGEITHRLDESFAKQDLEALLERMADKIVERLR